VIKALQHVFEQAVPRGPVAGSIFGSLNMAIATASNPKATLMTMYGSLTEAAYDTNAWLGQKVASILRLLMSPRSGRKRDWSLPMPPRKFV
jgi:hypothetical protein